MVMSYGDLYTINPEFFKELITEIGKDLEKSMMMKKENNMATKKKAPVEEEDEVVIPIEKLKENVNHPSWYGSKDDPYETIKVIQAWGLNFPLGNAVKYISRAGKKDPTKTVEDLRKALFYIQYEIDRIERDAKRI